jgi:hypothetical protein
MSDTRRATTISERITAREGAGTHRERLNAADQILWEELHKLQKNAPKDRDVLFADLGLETADFTYLADILSTALRGITARRDQVTSVLKRYPLITLSTLVGTALLSHGASFWESYAAQLRFPEETDAGDLLRPVIPAVLRKLNLTSFENADLGSQQFVGTITLHAGIPNQDLPGLLNYLTSMHLAGTAGDDSELIGVQMQHELVNGATAPASLISLARVLPNRAAEIFSRVYELQQYSTEYGGWPADEGELAGGVRGETHLPHDDERGDGPGHDAEQQGGPQCVLDEIDLQQIPGTHTTTSFPFTVATSTRVPYRSDSTSVVMTSPTVPVTWPSGPR